MQHAGVINRARGTELPCHIPYRALLSIIKSFQGHWGPYAAECLEQVTALLLSRVDGLVVKRFGQFPALEADVRCACNVRG